MQTTYTQVSNADIISCGKKGKPVKSEPIPLLKDKFLGEYRTALEKAKVRKNLGIADNETLEWGNITGIIESQSDLVNYVKTLQQFKSDEFKDLTNVQDALQYALHYVSTFESDSDSIAQLKESVSSINTQIQDLLLNTSSNSTSIEGINTSIQSINNQITKLNEDLKVIDVNNNISDWIQTHLSDTITIEDEKLQVVISEKENNALSNNEGLYVKDVSSEIEELQEKLVDTVYNTELPDDATSPLISDVTVSQLKNKSFTEIIDAIIFPTSVRDLVEPTLEYEEILQSVVEVGSALLTPTLIFTQNDAGEEISREESVTLNSTPVTSYDKIGTYLHQGVVNYAAGEYLINNKGETTNKRIEEGSITAELNITATYPWYAGTQGSETKQELVPFYKSVSDIDIYLTGIAVIKLPGTKAQINSFTVDGGLGYLNVNMSDWVESTETLNGITYKVWTKQSSYSAILPHKISFILNGV